MVAALLLSGSVAVLGHRYRVTVERARVPVAGGVLDAVIATPTGREAHGVLVFVHGDGPKTATDDGSYLPWWEAAADAGYVCVSWTKPGVEGSPGDWQDQTMADRARETGAVLDWVADRDDLPHGTIGLWGTSQAGLVVPTVAADRDDVDLAVLVVPAVDWLDQMRYQLLRELDDSGAGEAERATALALADREREMLEAGTPYTDYVDAVADPRVDRGRWDFNVLNATADASEDLRALADRDVPVLLMLADSDRVVDPDAAAAAYRDALGTGVEIARFDATHTMRRPWLEHRPLRETATVLWPRGLIAGGVLDTFASFLTNAAR